MKPNISSVNVTNFSLGNRVVGLGLTTKDNLLDNLRISVNPSENYCHGSTLDVTFWDNKPNERLVIVKEIRNQLDEAIKYLESL